MATLETSLLSETGTTFKTMSVMFCALNGCNEQMQKVEKKVALRETSGMRSFLLRLRWPFTETETKEAVNTLHQFAQLFHFAIIMKECEYLPIALMKGRVSNQASKDGFDTV